MFKWVSAAFVVLLLLTPAGSINPNSACAGTEEPPGADCTTEKSSAQTHQNHTPFTQLATVEVQNLGTCLVRVGTASDYAQGTAAITRGGQTQTHTLVVGPKGSEDRDGHSRDVLVASCDGRGKCDYRVDVIDVDHTTDRR